MIMYLIINIIFIISIIINIVVSYNIITMKPININLRQINTMLLLSKNDITSINQKEKDKSIITLYQLLTLSLIIKPKEALSELDETTGLLGSCITNKECISSQDDRPFCFLPPWLVLSLIVFVIIHTNSIKTIINSYSSSPINSQQGL